MFFRDAFKEFFDAHDTDGSGTLTPDEIRQFAEKDCGSSVEEILQQCDMNSDGKISYQEYVERIQG
jgi:Ca2+-binding EF-hand superfamily protein